MFASFLLHLFTEYGKQLSEEDIDYNLVKKFLKGTGSKLSEEQDHENPVHLYERLDLVTRIGDKLVGERLAPLWAPRNVALLLVSFIQPLISFSEGRKLKLQYIPMMMM